MIDWNGTDVPAGVGGLFAELPPGRYRLEAFPADDDAVELTAEGEAAIEAAMGQARAGRTLSLAEVTARMDAKLSALR